MARKVTVLCQIFLPYLAPIEADEIRAEVSAMNPRVHLILADWPYLEVRGLTEEAAERLLEMLRVKQVRFHRMGEVAGPKAARVSVAVETFGA